VSETSRETIATTSAAEGAARPRSPRYLSVDGLRGLAIVSVLFYHSNATGHGVFGVDVFLVITGFFVTLLLLREREKTGRIRVSAFWGRRVKRILPGLAVTLLGTLTLVSWLGPPSEWDRTAGTAIAAIAEVTNWHQIVAGQAYWNTAGGVTPLGHMWSLAVTEQMYIVGPLIVLAFTALSRRRPWLLVTLFSVLLVATALVGPLLYDGTNADRVYMGSDSRAVTFVAGALAAVIVHLGHRHLRGRVAAGSATTLSVLSLGVLVALTLLTTDYHQAWLYQGGQVAVAVTTAVLIGSLCVTGNLLGRVLMFRPLRFIGTISYLLFLVHLPIYWLLQLNFPGVSGWVLFAVGGTIAIVVASILHHMLAEPLYRRSWRVRSGTVAAVITAVSVVATALWLPPLRTVPAEASVASALLPTVPLTATGGKPKVVVVGDSIGVSFADALKTYAGDRVETTNIASGGCGLFDPDGARTVTGFTNAHEAIVSACWPWEKKLKGALASSPEYVVIHSGWDAADQLIGGTWTHPCEPAWKARYHEKLRALVDILRSAPNHPKVLLANERLDAPFVGHSDRVACFNDAIEGTLRANPDFTLLDYNSFLLGDGSSAAQQTPDGHPMFADGTHPTKEGQRFYAAWLLRNMVGQASSSEAAG